MFTKDQMTNPMYSYAQALFCRCVSVYPHFKVLIEFMRSCASPLHSAFSQKQLLCGTSSREDVSLKAPF